MLRLMHKVVRWLLTIYLGGLMLCRLIAPDWLLKQDPSIKKVLEGDFTPEQLQLFNTQGYNVYHWPNYPSLYTGSNVEGRDIDKFEWVFVDCDLKDAKYANKDAFLEELVKNEKLLPTKIVDSGNGIHAYWRVTDLDAMSYLRFQRRLCRLLSTDSATGMICQLMRVPGYLNNKLAEPKACELLYEEEVTYTSEQLDKLIPAITIEDEQFCQQHYNRVNSIEELPKISGKLPAKFGQLLKKNSEVKKLFSEVQDDRSGGDFRLGHIMLGNDFTKDEAMNVLYNSHKAMQRSPGHRYSYAQNIVDKIWSFEKEAAQPNVSPTVREILSKGDDVIKGKRFPCNRLVDDTEHGYRLGQVIGIIGGSGVGKTTLTLNMFLWFSSNNPDYHHFFFSLEQPPGEVASRIRTICGDDDSLFDRIHIVSNYADDGSYRHLSLKAIEEHIISFENQTKKKVGATVIDHIGVLSKETKNGENDGLIGVCRDMKSVAVRCNIMLLMLSQAPKEKSGVGDIELDKGAAYGTVFFESFVDYCLCLWQPLKRAYNQGAPTIMALKFVKIRHKRQGTDRIQEDVCYQVYFDPNNERLRELTQDEETSAKHFTNIATNLRKADKKTDIVPYQSRRLEDEIGINNNNDSKRH